MKKYACFEESRCDQRAASEVLNLRHVQTAGGHTGVMECLGVYRALSARVVYIEMPFFLWGTFPFDGHAIESRLSPEVRALSARLG